MVFRYESEAVPKVIRKLKVEINAREHFTLLGHHYINYAVNSGWFKGSTQIPTFFLEEMLATKLRALYQRRKGRDLFDLYTVMNEQEINLLNVVDMMHEYLRREGTKITSADFIANLDEKMKDPNFLGDTEALLRPEINFNSKKAWQIIKRQIFENI